MVTRFCYCCYILLNLLCILSWSKSQKIGISLISKIQCHDCTKIRGSLRTQDKDIGAFEYIQSALAGALSCSITHSLVVPLDVIKTKIQTNPNFANMNLYRVMVSVIRDHGISSLTQGLAATSSGYFLQGACKFGFYEYFKNVISCNLPHDLPQNIREKMEFPKLIIASGTAEMIASWALCPLEVTKIFMITNPQFSGSLVNAMRTIVTNDGFRGLFKGINWIMLRQVPYTCAKLAGYDLISTNLKKALSSHYQTDQTDIPGPELMDSWNSCIQISSGMMAGFIAAFISHPADVLLSKICEAPSVAAQSLKSCQVYHGPSTLYSILKQQGWKNSYAGFVPRAIMICVMTTLQFIVYEDIKLEMKKRNKK